MEIKDILEAAAAKQNEKFAKIGASFLNEVAKTGSISEAWNKVFTTIPFEDFAGDLYEALRAKA